MSICIFPGTFNPIHEAHIKMAEFALQKYNFDKIIFIPSYLPPHKEIDRNLADHRFKMVQLATKYNSKFEVSDIEYKSEGKSYSLITVKKLIDEYELKGKIDFIIGTDAFAKINSWYHAEELKPLVHFIVFPRRGDDIIYLENSGWNFEVVDFEYIDVSSTEIRQNKLNSTNKEVKEYIENNGLYS